MHHIIFILFMWLYCTVYVQNSIIISKPSDWVIYVMASSMFYIFYDNKAHEHNILVTTTSEMGSRIIKKSHEGGIKAVLSLLFICLMVP